MASGIVLVTAFEPFGGETVNASWEAARRVDGFRCGETVAAALVLPCAYGLCVGEFVSSVERMRPRAVLMTGQAARRGIVCVERLARNGANATLPDNRGKLGPTAAEGPETIGTTAPAQAIARAIREAGIPARVSRDAGDYVCNHLYYNALRRFVGAAPPIPAVFIHLPATPEQSPRGLATSDSVRALRAAVACLSSQAARLPSGR